MTIGSVDPLAGYEPIAASFRSGQLESVHHAAVVALDSDGRVAFAAGDFHRDFLAGRALAIACPKLDSQQDAYVAKLAALIDGAAIRSLTVAIMEVPCCGGLVRLAQAAAARAGRPVPLRVVVVGVQGQVLAEQELAPARPIAPPRASLPSLG